MSQFSLQVPDGDTLERRVCNTCGFIDYENPKIVVGSVVRYREQLLLCRRAIEPRYGFWTLPAGFLERHESAEVGAKREAWEEAQAAITITGLLAVYSIPRISQIQLMHIAHLETPEFAAGAESLEVKLFDWADIPWSDLAFPSVEWALHHRRQVWGDLACVPFTNP
jgi:ADP-ribose pyrophosphatase YjhB (NUDIX family)